ncbi:Alpha-1,3-mannosyltransferase-like protein [Tieghemiomyces parasiticus]|uniref:Alpha-1,3/1,6-mannosyltransferase ALG2 n=1 Tax=Tieghemiomyces parasiticus TaxID=78921 RepID=A0A9W8DVT9_9FUNG|nr:Alpha-1,3-mannosyltransferase-like protein [Tieghemiomyces parasiticus]
MTSPMKRPLRIALIHPDLGIGGAERLVVDAAVGLQDQGHEVTVYTSHHDPGHCFQETNDGTLTIHVLGNTLFPRVIFGRFYILCAILRGWHLVLALWLTQGDIYDVVVCDQLSAYLPLIRLLFSARTLFYCHFPDKYLIQGGASRLKRLYRLPFDYFEERTTALADRVVVNSRFTASIFKRAFPTITRAPAVLYPGIRLDAYGTDVNVEDPALRPLRLTKADGTDSTFLLSINRFERKKNVDLAIRTLIELRRTVPDRPLRLVVGGGYDPRVPENVQYLQELNILARDGGLTTHTVRSHVTEATPPTVDVLFVPSFTENQRAYLLCHALCLLYTPSFEHFGIVPVEAMYSRLPVVAVNNGGPKETVRDGLTGFLRSPTPEAFAEPIRTVLLADPAACRRLGAAGHEWARDTFGLKAFVKSLDETVHELADLMPRPVGPPRWVVSVTPLLLALWLWWVMN